MRRISNKPVSKDSVLDALNREIVPAIRSIQRAVLAISDVAIAAIEARLTSAESDIADHEARITTAETDIAAVELDVASLDASVTDHETRVSALEADDAAYRTTTYLGRTNTVGTAAATTYYFFPVGVDRLTSTTSTLTLRQMLWGRTGTIKNLRYINVNPNADTDTFSWTLNKNGAPTALTITGISPNTAAMQADTTHSVSVSAGDLIVIEQVVGALGLTGNNEPSWSFDFEEA